MTAASPTSIASTGQRSTQTSQAVQLSSSTTASNIAFMYLRLSWPLAVMPFMDAQQQGQQLHMLERCLELALA